MAATTGAVGNPRLDPILEDRESYIGGSEAHELLNETQYGKGCARALAYRKLQTPEDVPSESQKKRALSVKGIFQRGHLLEDVAAKLYMEQTGRSLIKRNRLVRNPDQAGAGVHTDRLVLAFDQRGTGDAEIKSRAEGVFLHILRTGLPPADNLQIQWSLFCTGHRWGVFIILGLFGELPLKHFEVERDAALMNIFKDATAQFWNGLKVGHLPPQLPDASDLRCKVCPFRFTCRGETLDPELFRQITREREGKKKLKPVQNDELDQALADRALIKSEIQALDSEDKKDPGALQLITARIRELVGEEEALLVNGHWKVYSHDNTWSGVDISRLKEEYPAAYKNCYVEKKPTGTKKLSVFSMHDGKERREP